MSLELFQSYVEKVLNTMGVKTEPRNVFCEELTNYRDALY